MLAGRGFRTMAFAAKLKKIVKDLFSLDDEQVHDQDAKEVVDPRWGLTPRVIMQRTGCGMRDIAADVWTRTVMDQVDQYPNVVVVDCRFMNEVLAVRAQGGFVVRIERPGAGSPTGATDESETALDGYTGWDAVLVNSGSLEELQDKVSGMLAVFRESGGCRGAQA